MEEIKSGQDLQRKSTYRLMTCGWFSSVLEKSLPLSKFRESKSWMLRYDLAKQCALNCVVATRLGSYRLLCFEAFPEASLCFHPWPAEFAFGSRSEFQVPEKKNKLHY